MNSHDKDRADDDLTALARLLPPPPEAELPPERHRYLKDVLMRQIDQDLAEPAAAEQQGGTAGKAAAPRSRSPLLRSRFLLPVAATLALATGLTATLYDGGEPGPTPAAAPSEKAVVLLDHIATAAQGSAVGTKAPGPDQHVYTRVRERENKGELGGPVKLGAAHTDERWMSQDPDPVTILGVTRETGKDAVMPGEMVPMETSVPDGEKGDGALRPGFHRPTYAWLASLPTDPDALLKRLYAEVEGDGRQTRDQAVFEAVGDLVVNNLMPPENAAAFYRAIARVPGVRKVPDAVDAAGRHGVGITLKRSAYATRDVWIFDRDTLAYLGSRSYRAEDGKPGHKEVLSGVNAVMELGVVDRVGAKPKKAQAAG
ncbi:CU044_5270 family protein [Streptomyces sp. PU-14G]|uniref:CU044_5270 family protein n=1 Tax=Streptomyces sp. PU-14G TaxID=2800808 RepID=UPI0034DF6008